MTQKPNFSLDADIRLELHCDECEGVKDEMFLHQSSVDLLMTFITPYVMKCSWTRIYTHPLKT